jgi:hypothetical protein
VRKADNSALGGGETYDDCTTDIKDPKSTCMEAVLQAHENVHWAYCDAHKQAGRPGARDWKLTKTMVEYWQEDIEGYEAELEKIEKEIDDINNDPDPNCHLVERPTMGESPEEQMERLHRARERVNEYVTAIS